MWSHDKNTLINNREDVKDVKQDRRLGRSCNQFSSIKETSLFLTGVGESYHLTMSFFVGGNLYVYPRVQRLRGYIS